MRIIVLLLTYRIWSCLTAVIYVNVDNTVQSPDGSPANPFPNLQAAILYSNNGDEIKLMSNITLISNTIIMGKKLTLSSQLSVCSVIFSKLGAITQQMAELTVYKIIIGFASDFGYPYMFGLFVQSTLRLESSTLQDVIFPSSLQTLILSDSSTVNITKSEFSRINVNISMLVVMKGLSAGLVLIVDTLFTSFSQSMLTPGPTLLIKDTSAKMVITGSTFKRIFTYSGFIGVSGSKESIKIENCLFQDNWAYAAFIGVSMAFSINIINTSTLNLNIVDNIKLPEGGCFIGIQNVPLRNFTNYSLTNANSDKTTVGIKIVDSTALLTLLTDLKYAGPHYVSFEGCTFQNITTFYKINKESGGAIIIGVAAPMFFNNCLFRTLYINSSRNANEKVGGPCILSGSRTNQLFISNSIFADSHSRFAGNGIIFFGSKLVVTNCKFENNNPIFDIDTVLFYNANWANYASIMDLHMEVGGALLCMTEDVVIKNSTFIGNMGYAGGAVFVNCKIEKPNVVFVMSDCYFLKNRGGIIGGGVAFFQDFVTLEAKIDKTVFEQNAAYFGGGVAQYTTRSECYVRVNNCSFIKNLADLAGALDFSNREGSAFITNCLIIGNIGKKSSNITGAGSAIKISGTAKTLVYSTNNKYLMNWAIGRGAVILYDGSFFDIGSQFSGNWATDGSTSYMLSTGESYYYNTTFYNETSGKAGIFIVKELSLLVMVNVTFESCWSPERGGIFVFAERSILNVQISKFKNSSSKTGAILYSFENFRDISSKVSLNFTKCIFQNSNGSSTVFDIADTYLFLINCTITQSINTLFNLVTSFLYINGLFIDGQKCYNDYSGCLFCAITKSNILISGMSAQKVENTVEGGGFYLEDSNLIMNLSSLVDVFSAKGGSSILCRLSTIYLSQNSFLGYNGNSIKASLSNMTVLSNNFDNLGFDSSKLPKSFEIYTFGALVCDGCLTLMISNSNFTRNIFATRGGAIELLDSENNILSSSDINIRFSIFRDNSAASDGGAIYIEDLNTTFDSNTFTRNKAVFGGAIYYFTNDYSLSKIKLIKNTFKENEASMEGGAIKFNENVGDFNQEIFQDNKAQYGADVATYPVGLRVNVYDSTNKTLVMETNPEKMITFSDISSGNIFPFVFEVLVIDTRGELVKSLEDKEIEVNFVEEKELESLGLRNWNRTGYSSTPKPSLIKNGVAQFNEFQIITKPNNQVYLKMTSKTIKRFYTNIQNSKYGESSIDGQYALILNVKTRDCVIGERFISGIQTCKICELGKFSLEIPEKANCIMCPDGAFCPGGKDILPLPGYWKNFPNSTIIHQCGNWEEYCLGGEARSCKHGYTGPLCSSCDTQNGAKYSRLGLSTCVECLGTILNAIRISFIFIAFLIMLWILVNSANKEAARISREGVNIRKIPLKKFLSIYLKILMNYIHMVSIISGMDLRWPYYVESYLNVQSNIGNVGAQVISVECLILDMEVDTNAIYVRAVAASIVPFFVIFGFFAMMGIGILLKKPYTSTNFIICYVVINVFLQPTVLRELTNVLNCVEFENGIKVVRIQREIDCSSSMHKSWSNKFIYPMLVYWIFLYPISCLSYLIKNREELEDPKIRSKFGFFLNGYKINLFFWEFTIMYRKILIIMIAVLFDLPVMSKATMIIFINFASTFFTAKLRPFLVAILNDLEFQSNLCSLITIYAGIFYINIDDDIGKAFLFLAILAVNLNFFLIWLKSLATTVFGSQLERIYKCFPNMFHRFVALSEAKENVSFLNFHLFKNLSKLNNQYKEIYRQYCEKEKILNFEATDTVTTMNTTFSPKHGTRTNKWV